MIVGAAVLLTGAVAYQVVYHIHAELMVFVAGESRVIPEGIGIVGCFY